MINNFEKELLISVISSMSNHHTDNYDFYRFGNRKKEKFSLRKFIKNEYIIKKFLPRNKTLYEVEQTLSLIQKYGDKLNTLFGLLDNDISKNLLIAVITYRILGEEKVKLPANTPEFWKQSTESINYADMNDSININFLHWKLFKTNYQRYNLNLNLYCIPHSMVEYCYLGHYFYESSESKVGVTSGDVVIDCGGCYGDTAMMFAHHAGNTGRVYSFEFIPSNIEIFNKNIALNPEIKNVEIVKHPLWVESNLKLYYKDDGPGSLVSSEEIENADGIVSTITIDDFIKSNSIQKVSYIKMDIEGSELPALKGAVNTIRTFKPKLAISIYHSMDDFVDIPLFIEGLNLNYKLYLGHHTIHTEETVIYAIAD
jgi:FkbM family methyltransferase